MLLEDVPSGPAIPKENYPLEDTMNRSILSVLSLILPLAACTVTLDDTSGHGHGHTPNTVVDYGSSPFIEWADSGCYWDSAYGDYIWWFEADVTDADGLYDVAEVVVDVYDDYWGEWVETFELLQESPNPDNWFSDWMEYSTWLDCGYSGYTVAFTAYDFDDNMDVVDVIPYTEY